MATTQQNTFNNVVAVNNTASGFGSTPNESNNTFSQIVATNNADGVSGEGTNNGFFGTLIVGNNSTTDCFVSGGSTGLIPGTCTNTGTDGSSAYTGQISTAVLRTGRSLASSFVGKVTKSDSANACECSTDSYPASPNEFDFMNFLNHYRGWGLSGSAFPSTNNQGQWTSGTGQIWDFRLLASDTQVLNKSGNGSTENSPFVPYANCPSAVNGNITATDRSGRTYLLNAMEIVDPFTPGYSNSGNHNGLCETGETCIYTPNFGSYQGDGALKLCTFVSSGGLTGITMYGYVSNGAQ